MTARHERRKPPPGRARSRRVQCGPKCDRYTHTYGYAPDRDLLSDARSLLARERGRIAHDLILSLDEVKTPVRTPTPPTLGWKRCRARKVDSGAVATEDWSTIKARPAPLTATASGFLAPARARAVRPRRTRAAVSSSPVQVSVCLPASSRSKRSGIASPCVDQVQVPPHHRDRRSRCWCAAKRQLVKRDDSEGLLGSCGELGR
jgi:hypothetical protein